MFRLLIVLCWTTFRRTGGGSIAVLSSSVSSIISTETKQTYLNTIRTLSQRNSTPTIGPVVLVVLLLLLEQLPVVGRLVRVQLAALVLDGGPPAAGRALVRVDDALAVDGPRTRRAEDGFRFVRLDLAVRE